jgi:hypothetical protein
LVLADGLVSNRDEVSNEEEFDKETDTGKVSLATLQLGPKGMHNIYVCLFSFFIMKFCIFVFYYCSLVLADGLVSNEDEASNEEEFDKETDTGKTTSDSLPTKPNSMYNIYFYMFIYFLSLLLYFVFLYFTIVPWFLLTD